MHPGYKFLVLGLTLLLGAPTAVKAQELPLGSSLPMQDQAVQSVDGSSTTIGALTGSKGTVFIFWSNQCPWIDKYKDRITNLHGAFSGQGVAFVAVNANDASAFPQEAASGGQQQGLPMPYVLDAGSSFAKALGASRTPHVYVFDANKTLVYEGTIDDSPGDPGNVQHTYLRDALSQVVQGGAVPTAKTKAFGCTIKFWN